MEGVLERYWPWLVRFIGIGIVLWQLILDNADRPYLLLLAGGMIGLKNVKDIADALGARKKD